MLRRRVLCSCTVIAAHTNHIITSKQKLVILTNVESNNQTTSFTGHGLKRSYLLLAPKNSTTSTSTNVNANASHV